MAQSKLTPKQRREKQTQQLDLVLSLPPEMQPGALIGIWPNHLPRLVKKTLPSETKRQWRKLRSQAKDKRMARQGEMLDMAVSLAPQKRMLLAQLGYNPMMMVKHGDQGREVLRVVLAPENEKIISVGLACLPEQEHNFHLPGKSSSMSTQDPAVALLLRMICLAIATEGVILIHQQLPIKTQVPGKGGDFDWKHPERIHAIYCGTGTWAALDPNEIRHMYREVEKESDYDGAGVLTFGSIEELVGRK